MNYLANLIHILTLTSLTFMEFAGRINLLEILVTKQVNRIPAYIYKPMVQLQWHVIVSTPIGTLNNVLLFRILVPAQQHR